MNSTRSGTKVQHSRRGKTQSHAHALIVTHLPSAPADTAPLPVPLETDQAAHPRKKRLHPADLPGEKKDKGDA